MAGNILNIGKSGLFAAQAALSTTGHNIANANVAGYTRQLVVQSSAVAQNVGYGFVGSGTQVAEIKRYSDDFLNVQVRSAQASKSALDSYYAQVSQVDNLLSDPTTGLSPALQEFFKGVQDVASTPASAASRQAMLSNAESLATRFQGLDGRLSEIREGVNREVTTNVSMINSYAQQIASLNEQIGKYSTNDHIQPNDLLDRRDQLVMDLNKQVRTSVVKADNNTLTISIGNGQPLVVGKKAFALAVTTSTSDMSRLEVGYVTGNKVTVLSDQALAGGELGGLLDFRANTLDRAQNSLGRIALSLAHSFNAQHSLGQDATGALGGDFFKVAPALVYKNQHNSMTSTTEVKAVVSDPSKLTQSDYALKFDGTSYIVTRQSDNKPFTISPFPQTKPQTIDGVDFSVTGNAAPGDSFLIRPTANGAAQFDVLLTDRAQIAAAAPFATATPLTNSGSGKISEGSADAAYLVPANQLAGPLTMTFNKTAGTLDFSPARAVKMTAADGSVSNFAAGTPVTFSAGASYSSGGINVTLSGAPADGDKFTVSPNAGGSEDNRNMRLLGGLQLKPILDGNSSSFQSSYGELISFIGNKTREVQANGAAGEALLAQTRAAQQSVSGVNLDEEASNLLKYQQAYQAAGKVMQMASSLFDTLLSLGR